jgi:hypothetical protein
MVANIRGFTPNYDFKLINFDTPRWHTLEYSNWTLLDALLTQAGISHVKGEWTNSTDYIEGERVVDVDDNLIYRCQEGHRSSPTGSFADERIAHPTYWAHLIEAVPIYRGAWSSGVAYDSGDIVHYTPYTYYLCATAHTSTVAFDPAMWVVIFDATAVVDAAALSEANAAASAAAADTSEANAAASAVAADLSADAAAADAAEAALAADNALSAQGAFKWKFINDATVSDPGIGNQKYNNSNIALATKLSISGRSADSGNPNVQQWLMTWDDSTSIPVKGTIYVRKLGFPDNFFIFNIIGTAVDHTTWVEFDVVFLSQNGVVAPGEPTTVGFARTGNTGGAGAGTGDMLRANNLSDVANIATSRTNLGLGAAQTPTFAQFLVDFDPTLPRNVVTKGYLEGGTALASKVSVAGDTMTGALAINPTGADPFPGAFLEVSDSLSGSLSYSPTWAWFEQTVWSDTSVPIQAFGRSRGTHDLTTPVVQGDMIGTIYYNASDGGDWQGGAAINAYVDGPVAVGAVPMALQFCTGSVSGGSEHLLIRSDGGVKVGPNPPLINDGKARQFEVNTPSKDTFHIFQDANGVISTEIASVSGANGYGPWGYVSMGRGTHEAPAAVQVGDAITGTSYFGYSGVWGPPSASFTVQVDGPVTPSHVPMALVWSTGDGTPADGVERLRIGADGTVATSSHLTSKGDIYAGITLPYGTYHFGNNPSTNYLQHTGSVFKFSDSPLHATHPTLAIGAGGTWGNLYFGNTGTKYLGFDGTSYTLNGGALTVGGATTSNGRLTSYGDIMTCTPSNYGIGTVYFGNSGGVYITYNGSVFGFTHPVQTTNLNVTGTLTTNSTVNINQAPAWIYQVGQMPTMFQSWSGYTAGVSFHNAGSFAVNFGLGSDNVLRVGGWSLGSTWFKLWTAQDVGDVVINTRLVYVGDVDHGNGSGLQEPWGNACVTGMTGLSVYSAWVARYRLLQVHATAGYYNSELG